MTKANKSHIDKIAQLERELAELKAKSKEESQPRLAKSGLVVELVQGDTWVDDKSGINLQRGHYRMATKVELEDARLKGNTDITQKGYIKLDCEINPTAVIPKDKDISRVEKALRLGILKIFNSKRPTNYVERDNDKFTRFITDPDGNQLHRNKNDKSIDALLKLSIAEFEKSVQNIKSEEVLVKIFDAEYEGRNPTAVVRHPYISILKKHMKTKREKLVLSGVITSEEENIKIEIPK